MKIGQPFYKINSNNIPSTFNDHKFSVLFVLGITQNNELNVVLECTSADLTIVETLTEDRARNGYYVVLNYDADAFSKLSDSEQNNVIFTEFGYVANPEDLRTQFNSIVEDRLIIERDHITQWRDRLDEIEDSIDNPIGIFNVGVHNIGDIHINDSVTFFSNYSEIDVTAETLFYVESSLIGPVGINLFVPDTSGIHTVIGVYQHYSFSYTFNVLP